MNLSFKVIFAIVFIALTALVAFNANINTRVIIWSIQAVILLGVIIYENSDKDV